MDLIILVIASSISLALGGFVFLRNHRADFARTFAAISLFITIWLISNFVTDLGNIDLTFNNIANRIAFVSSYATVLAGLSFTYVFPVKREIKQLEIILVTGISFVVMGLSTTSLIAGTATHGMSGELLFSIGPLLWLYVVGFIILLLLIARNLLKIDAKLSKSQVTQSRLVLAAFLVTSVLGLILNVVLPVISDGWHTTKFTPFVATILVCIIVYAIARHKLFDVRLAVVRTFAYVLSLGTLVGVYYILATILSNLLFGAETGSSERDPLSIGLALLVAFFFQPTKRLFDRVTNRIFYKDNYSSSAFYTRLNQIVTSTADLRTLLTRSAHEIATTLKTERVSYIVKRQNARSIFAGTGHYKQLPVHDITAIDEYMEQAKTQVVIASELTNRSGDKDMHRLMISHRIELIMSLTLSDRHVGYICLGEQKSSGFTQRDVRVLETAANELTVAIQNVLGVEEIRDLNANLQQRINEATKELRASNHQLQRLDEAKDEFISMASHQLRTPLTSIKGYVSMLMEGDAGKISDNQKHLLREAFVSSERMVRLINDFLNVSRLQTGKFVIEKRTVDLAKVVGQELDSLEPTAGARRLKFSYRAPKKLPLLNLDEDKMRQVIMNFVDNAIYYSKENSTIKIDLRADAKEVTLTVKDTGIGVPASEQDHLFNKFFRATNARKQRPDGTGVGLFLAKKVIDAHDGTIVFESKEGKGSTFGFRLPLRLVAASQPDKLKR